MCCRGDWLASLGAKDKKSQRSPPANGGEISPQQAVYLPRIRNHGDLRCYVCGPNTARNLLGRLSSIFLVIFMCEP